MAAFLVRALHLTDGLSDPFSDDDDSVFEADIERLAAAGITKGCNPPVNDEYCPDARVTRAQMAAFLVRALGYTDDGGGDLFLDDDYSIFEADIDRLATVGVTQGCNPPINDRFCPEQYVTRGQMAAFLHEPSARRPSRVGAARMLCRRGTTELDDQRESPLSRQRSLWIGAPSPRLSASWQTRGMISIELARRLRDAGLEWVPAEGDRFMIPDRDLEDQRFSISEMTVEVHRLRDGQRISFNGAVEWALDSIMQQEVIWLPSEAQLRDRLGRAFESLQQGPNGYKCNLLVHGMRAYVCRHRASRCICACSARFAL